MKPCQRDASHKRKMQETTLREKWSGAQSEEERTAVVSPQAHSCQLETNPECAREEPSRCPSVTVSGLHCDLERHVHVTWPRSWECCETWLGRSCRVMSSQWSSHTQCADSRGCCVGWRSRSQIWWGSLGEGHWSVSCLVHIEKAEQSGLGLRGVRRT